MPLTIATVIGYLIQTVLFACLEVFSLVIATSDLISRYRISPIRRRGYYLFHRTIFRGHYSRAATNRGRHLLD